MAVTMKNAFFWDVMPYGSWKKLHFGGMYHLHHQDEKKMQTRNNVSTTLYFFAV
jgi:hypothetical protein